MAEEIEELRSRVSLLERALELFVQVYNKHDHAVEGGEEVNIEPYTTNPCEASELKVLKDGDKFIGIATDKNWKSFYPDVPLSRSQAGVPIQ
jgi:hypothetical protein